MRLTSLLGFFIGLMLALSANAQTNLTATTVVDGLEHPWALDFLPDGRALVTERPGRLRILQTDGTLSEPLAGVPAVHHEGQGGLLDVLAAPDFDESKQIYFTYAEPGTDDTAGTAVAMATLGENSLENVTVIFRQQPKVEGDNHFGSRLAFDGEGYLFIGLGERFDYSEQAQTLDNHLGKVIRLHADGSVPEDNPFVDTEGALPEIWSYGHRNIQGMATHPQTGKVWLHEHGPRGGDEINIPQAGQNYGWPEASYGSHYSFIPIEDNHSEQGFAEPIHHWTPSIAPSGMVFYTGDAIPQWKGNVFVGALAKTHLARLKLDANTVVEEEQLLAEHEARIRDVTQGPDGVLYVLTDSDNGEIWKLSLHP